MTPVIHVYIDIHIGSRVNAAHIAGAPAQFVVS